MKTKKVLLAVLLAIAGTTAMSAEEELVVATDSVVKKEEKAKVEGILQADFVSQYVWRGLKCGGVSVQPSLGIEYKGLSLSAWGSIGFNPTDTKELDLTLGYANYNFCVGLTDYWFDTDAYFKYKANNTSHVFEAFAGYDFKYVSLTWYTNFAGNDGLNSKGKRAYSSYFEINVPFTLATCDWNFTVGCVPYATTFYNASTFAVTNVALSASKDIKIKNFTLPLFASLIANPNEKSAAFVFGFTLNAIQ